MSQKAILTFIGVVAAVGTAAFFINKARAEDGELPCAPAPTQISIDQIIPIRQEGSDFFWIFDAKYRNRTCIPMSFNIIMQIERFDADFGRFVVRDIQDRSMTLNPGETQGFEWHVIFTELIKHRITFFVWETINSAIPVGTKKIITIL